MTKSELEKARQRLLPEKGAEFAIGYYGPDGQVKYGEEPHVWANAVSEGLRVMVLGEDAYVAMRKQAKPLLPGFFLGAGASYRRMVVVKLGEVWIHVLGGLVVVGRQSLKVAQLVQDESLTPDDADLLHWLRTGEAPFLQGE